MPKRVKGATITFEEITREIGNIPLSELQETHDFVTDNQWNNGKYWIGWRPQPDSKGHWSEAAMRQWQYVCDSFTQKNVIGSNLNRLEGAILGNEPDFDIVSAKAPKPLDDPAAEAKRERTDDEKFFDDIDDMIVNWWTQKEVHQTFKTLLRNKASFGKTAILVRIPSGYLEPQVIEVPDENDSEALVKKQIFALPGASLSFEEILDKIVVEVVDFSIVIDVKDPEFGTTFSVVKFNPEKVENGSSMLDRYGVFYVDTDKRSYFRVVNSEDKDQTLSCDLAGNNLCLTFGDYEKALITPSVKKLQKAVNHAETGSNYALANINYPETTFINTAPIEKSDTQGNTTGAKVQPKQGLGIFRYLYGVILETATGQMITTPTIHERQGADPEKFSKESERKSRDIDMLMGMGYKHLADSEYASGDSKARSMDDLDILITDFETSINTIGTKVIESVIRLAFNFTKQTSKNREFNVLFHVNVSKGQITNEDKTTMMSECEKGLRSDESYMLIAKVSDNPVLEKQRIAAQPPKQLPPTTGNGNGNGGGNPQ